MGALIVTLQQKMNLNLEHNEEKQVNEFFSVALAAL